MKQRRSVSRRLPHCWRKGSLWTRGRTRPNRETGSLNWVCGWGSEKQPVRAAVNETAVGIAIQMGHDFGSLISRIHCHSGRRVVGLGADAEHEGAVDRGRPACRDVRKLDDHAVVILRKNATGFWT